MSLCDTPKALASARLLGFLAAASGCAGAAHAARELIPQVGVDFNSNTNPRLLAEPTTLGQPPVRSATRLAAQLGLQFSSFSPRGEFVLQPTVRSDAYAKKENSGLQSTDEFLQSNAEYRWQRTKAGFSANLANEKILGAEVLAAQPQLIDGQDPSAFDLVLPSLDERRKQGIISPYTQFALSTRNSLRFDGRYTNVTYVGSGVTARTNFTDSLIGAEIDHQLSPLNTLSGRIFRSAFHAAINQNRTTSVGAELLYQRELSNIWSLNGSFGEERSDFGYIGAGNARVTGFEDDLTFELGAKKHTERSDMSVSYREHVSPDSFGFLTTRDELTFSLKRQMSPVLSADTALRLIRLGSVGNALKGNRRYGRVDFDVNWAVSRTWSVVFSYRYFSRSVEFVSPVARSNSVSVGVQYQGLSRRRSSQE